MAGLTLADRAASDLSKPRIRPVDPDDMRPVSVSARLGRLQFHDSGKFRVLVLADIQDGPKVNKDTIKLIEAALDSSRPDIVIFSGNQIAGYDQAYAKTFRKRTWTPQKWPMGAAATSQRDTELEHTRELVRQEISQFLSPLIERRIPWAVTYGNHDFQCGLSCAELDEIYREFPGCLNPEPQSSVRTVPASSPAAACRTNTSTLARQAHSFCLSVKTVKAIACLASWSSTPAITASLAAMARRASVRSISSRSPRR